MISYHVFTLPVHDPGAAETEFNGFLASHRVLSVVRRFAPESEIETGTNFATVDFSVRSGKTAMLELAKRASET
jgi:hypothetical protein